jgi:hypothetical protein
VVGSSRGRLTTTNSAALWISTTSWMAATSSTIGRPLIRTTARPSERTRTASSPRGSSRSWTREMRAPAIGGRAIREPGRM